MKRFNNDATRFILPMLYHIEMSNNKIFKYDERFFIANNFINCFIGDKNKSNNGYVILLNYEVEKTYEFEYLEDNIIRHPLYVDDYIIQKDNSLQIVYMFRVPYEYYLDFHFVKSGWYSKVSPGHKAKVLDFWRLTGHNLVYSILHKTDLILDHMKKINSFDRLMENSNPGEYWFKFDLLSNNLT